MPAERMPEAFCTNQPGEAKITGPLNTKQRKQVFKRISYKQSDFPLSLTVVVMKLGEHAELKVQNRCLWFPYHPTILIPLRPWKISVYASKQNSCSLFQYEV